MIKEQQHEITFAALLADLTNVCCGVCESEHYRDL